MPFCGFLRKKYDQCLPWMQNLPLSLNLRSQPSSFYIQSPLGDWARVSHPWIALCCRDWPFLLSVYPVLLPKVTCTDFSLTGKTLRCHSCLWTGVDQIFYPTSMTTLVRGCLHSWLPWHCPHLCVIEHVLMVCRHNEWHH